MAQELLNSRRRHIPSLMGWLLPPRGYDSRDFSSFNIEASDQRLTSGTPGLWMRPHSNEIEARAASSVTPTNGTGLRVLLVEDNIAEADALQRLLHFWGHEPRVAPTGYHGLHEARHWLPEAIIVDIRLLGALDGFAVARILRRHPDTAKARFIGVSGAPEIVDHSLEKAPFDEFFPKPIDTDGLRRLLRDRDRDASGPSAERRGTPGATGQTW
jgi:CheY-like chemotaxis protein